MNKKAFTLIELLAVIVILAIIALITVPIILHTIDESKKASFEATKRNIEDIAENYMVLNAGNLEFKNGIYHIPLEDLEDFLESVQDPNGNSCTGRVKVVTLEDGTYDYIAELTCGEGYEASFDITPPTINLNGDETIYLWQNIDTYVEKVSVIDNVDGNVTYLTTIDIERQSDKKLVDSIDNTKLDTYIITYTAYDFSLNQAKKTRTVIVREDTDAPIISIVNDTIGVRTSHSVTVNIDDDTNVEKYYQWTTTSTTPTSDSTNWISYEYDSEITGTESIVYQSTGTYYLHIKAVDQFNNESIESDDNALVFDNTNPSIILNIDNSNVAKSHTVDIDVVEPHISVKQYKWTTSIDIPSTGWVDFTTDALTLDNVNGDYYLHTKIVDKSGNETITTSPKMTFDNTNPNIVIEIDNVNYEQSHTIVTTITDTYINNGKTYYIFNTSSTTPTVGDTNWVLYTGNNITKSGVTGNYYMHIKAVDDAGNISTKTSGVIKFDNIDPTITLNPTSITTGASLTVTITPNDTGGSTVNYYRYSISNDNGTTWGTWTEVIGITQTTRTFDTSALYKIKAEVYDKAGNSKTVTSGTYNVEILEYRYRDYISSGYYDDYTYSYSCQIPYSYSCDEAYSCDYWEPYTCYVTESYSCTETYTYTGTCSYQSPYNCNCYWEVYYHAGISVYKCYTCYQTVYYSCTKTGTRPATCYRQVPSTCYRPVSSTCYRPSTCYSSYTGTCYGTGTTWVDTSYWTAWSAWSLTPVTATSTRQVETRIK